MQRFKESGLSLVGVMVAIGLVGILSLIFSQMMTNQSNHQKSLELRGDILAMKKTIIEQADCSRTMPGGTCTLNQYVPLVTANGRQILPAHDANGVKRGSWTLRAHCRADGVHVEYAKFAPNTTNFAKDPLTGKVLGWRPLIDAGGMICEASGGGEGAVVLGGKCRHFRREFAIGNGTLSPDGSRHTIIWPCPDDYPFALSVDEGGSCGSANPQAQAIEVVNKVPTKAMCSIAFLNYRKDLTPSQKDPIREKCREAGAEFNKTTCSYTCCKR